MNTPDSKFIEKCKEIAEHCACHDDYCFFREVVIHQKPSLRMIIQLDAMERWKYEESERQKHDVGDEAAMLWVTEGFAKAFAEVYNEDLTIKEIYNRTIIRQKELDKEKEVKVVKDNNG